MARHLTSVTRPRSIDLWDGTSMPLLDNDDIEALPLDDRERYITKLHGHMLDHGREASPWYHDWKRFDARCRAEDCNKERYSHHRFCIRHLDIADIDPEAAVRQKAVRAKLRMAELLDISLDALENIVKAAPGEIPEAVRLKAVSEVFDRANLPRQTASSVQVEADINVTSMDAAEIVAARLDRLAGSIIQGEVALTAELEAAFNQGPEAEDPE